MRLAPICGVVAVVAALLNGCQIEAPAFAFGEVSVFQAKTSKFTKTQLGSKQLADLRQWLMDRKSGWSTPGKLPPETVVLLTAVDGKTFQIRISGNSVMANDLIKEFSEKEIFLLKSILGITIDG